MAKPKLSGSAYKKLKFLETLAESGNVTKSAQISGIVVTVRMAKVREG